MFYGSKDAAGRAGRLISALLVLGTVIVRAAEPDPAGVEFFEKKIRPILVDHCYSCHSDKAEKGIKGGLRLDSREGVLKGGDTGPALVPNEVEKSLLIKAVRYTDPDLKMPPKNKKLSAQQIADLESWVRMGAPDPRTGAAASVAKASTHWAFQPVKNPAVPAVKNKRWVQSPIDAFVLAKLEEKKLSPSPRADKRTLIRRATFDLTGLPPTMEQVEEFLNDKTQEAFARVVDRLLSSPEYGERWGRHWLDIARYADTKGYLAGNEERKFPYSYTYRDYVIRAFNEDLPYDRFLKEQIAADRMDLGEDKRPLAALGFLTLGRRFLNNIHDIIDDRIDVVCRGTMGLTVACARCHDHKYDPIPTADYYSLYGVFMNSHEPEEKPLLGKNSMPEAYDDYLAEKKKRETALEGFRTGKENETLQKLRDQAGTYLATALEILRMPDQSKMEEISRGKKLDPGVVRRWMDAFNSWKGAHNPVFAPLVAYYALPDAEFAARSAAAAATLKGDKSKPVSPLVSARLLDQPPASLKEAAERYGHILSEIDKEWQALQKKDAAARALPDADRESIRQVLYANNAPANPPRGDLARIFDVPSIERVRELKRQLDELDAVHPGAPPRAMALEDNASFGNPHILKRGNPGNIGPQVPRQFLEVMAGPNRKPFTKGSGRLELAEAIASRSNPLTARVFVNRVWAHHFGSGFVRTPSDFGVRSDPPTHPELLDYLAWQFMENGWSVKKLHRMILLSSVYQQSSEERPEYTKVDPSNQLLGKMNRKRLEFEAMRDSMLQVSGKLDRKIGGHSVDITTSPFSGRRTIYGFIDRQNLPSVFRTFDFANPDSTSPQRFFTTVPQQALFMMNNPFVLQEASNIVVSDRFKSARTEEEKVRLLYRELYQRVPSPDELEMARKFLKSTVRQEPLNWKYGWGEVDEASRKVKKFTPLSQFSGKAWQDPKTDKNLELGPEGGRPGKSQAVIRRWVAPRDGNLILRAKVSHSTMTGDGIRARIVSSRSGFVGQWKLKNQEVETNGDGLPVKKGDTIDFIVDSAGTPEGDEFKWSPILRYESAGSSEPNAMMEWDASRDFAGPAGNVGAPPQTWERYAQVLLLSNEFMFVD